MAQVTVGSINFTLTGNSNPAPGCLGSPVLHQPSRKRAFVQLQQSMIRHVPAVLWIIHDDHRGRHVSPGILWQMAQDGQTIEVNPRAGNTLTRSALHQRWLLRVGHCISQTGRQSFHGNTQGKREMPPLRTRPGQHTPAGVSLYRLE